MMHTCRRKRHLHRFEEGISLIALIITIIVIIILAFIVIGGAVSTPESAGKAKFLGNLSQIKESVSIKRAQNLMQTAANPTGDRNYGFTKVMIKKSTNSTAEDGWVVNLDNINIKNSEYGAGYTEVAADSEIVLGTEASDVYICDAAGEVYYAKGFKSGEDTIYALSYIIGEGEPINWTSNTVTGTSIVLNDTFDDSAFVKINGKSEQEIISGYTYYDYIQSTGTQYINTGIAITQNNKVDISFLLTSFTNGNLIFGSRYGPSDNNIGIFSDTSTLCADFNNSNYTPYRNIYSGPLINNKYRIVDDKTGRYIYNESGLVLASNTISNTDTISIPINAYIFNMNGNPPGNYEKLKGKVFYCKIYENNILVRNFIPAKRDSDNAIGMYDLVNNVFYTNSGTGTFVTGNIITLPTPDYPIEINNVENFDLIVEDENQIKQTINLPYILRSLPDGTKDYIEIDNIAKTAKLYKFTETITFSSWASGWNDWNAGTKRVLLEVPGKATGLNTFGYCNIARVSNTQLVSTLNYLSAYSLNALAYWTPDWTVMGLNGTETMTVANQKLATFLSSNPITFTYKLTTPIVIDLNYEEVVTYYPCTKISTNSVVQPNMEVTYKMPGS